MRWLRFSAACVLALAACGAGRSGDGPGPDRRVLTAEEVEELDAADLYEVVRRRRPEWLRAIRLPGTGRDIPPLVYVDGQRFGGPASLRSITPPSVRYVEYLNATESHARFGNATAAGTIHVVTRATISPPPS
jgi:hypothetical protein